MNKQKLNRLAIIVVIGMMVLLAAKTAIIDEWKLKRNHRYTIAKIIKISYPAEGGPDADFTYCIAGKIYTGFADINVNLSGVGVGNKYLAMYYPANPNIVRIILNKKITDTTVLPKEIYTCR